MRKLELEEIKQIEYDILVAFDKLCEENHLYYTLSGGTLLGAIRHKGFIPWDDDIDVMMPRPDYDRLLHTIDVNYENFPSYLKVEKWTDGSNEYPFIKVVDKRTKLSAEFYDESRGTTNVWIDVFPIEGNPDDGEALKKLHKKSLFMRKILCTKMAKNGEGTTLIKRILKPFVKLALCPVSFHSLCKKIDNWAKQYDYHTSNKVGCVMWGYGVRESMSKAGYDKPVKVQFEKGEFNAPSNYEEYLSNLYGDYMKLPPEDQRVVHGLTVYMEE